MYFVLALSPSVGYEQNTNILPHPPDPTRPDPHRIRNGKPKMTDYASVPKPLKPSRFLERLVNLLIPYFLQICPDFDSARDEILETLASYGPRTRAEMLCAAQVVAYSMSGLGVLEEAAAPNISPSMRLRFSGCANGLSRSAQQSQAALDKRLKSEATSRQLAEEDIQIDEAFEAQVIEQVRQTQLLVEAAQERLARTNPEAARRAIPTQHDLDSPPWRNPMLAAAIATTGPPAAPASAAR
jgi:hypothetical protein